MPIFEFTCNMCRTGKKFSVLVGVVAQSSPPKCPKCGGIDLKKAVSRFARVRSEDETIDSLAEQADNMNMDDPKAMRGLMREMAGEMGEDLDGDDFEQMMEEEMSGGPEDAAGSGDE